MTRPLAVPNHFVPVTLFFVRDLDDRTFRLLEYMDPELISKEECLTFILRQWGLLPNFRTLRFSLMINGHVKPVVTHEIIRQYVNQAKGEANK